MADGFVVRNTMLEVDMANFDVPPPARGRARSYTDSAVEYFSSCETEDKVSPLKDVDAESDNDSTDAGGISEMDAGSSSDQSSCVVSAIEKDLDGDDDCVELSEDEDEPAQPQMAPQMAPQMVPVMMMAPQMVAVQMPMQGMMAMTFAPCVNVGAKPENSSSEKAQCLEQKARTLSDYAAQLKAAAKRTKQAAATKTKPRRGELIHWPSSDNPRKSSEDSIESAPACTTVSPSCKEVAQDERTTLMLQNLPSNYTRDALCSLLDSAGARGHYNFVYLPKDFKTMAGFGYAFVNFASNSSAVQTMDKLQGFSKWEIPSQKVLSVVWSNPHQGLHAHIERYRDSPVMHDDMADEFKPILLENGQRVAFPLPTKRLKPPRVRKASGLDGSS